MGHILNTLNNNNNNINEELYDNLSKLQAKLDNENIQKDALNKINNKLENENINLKDTVTNNELELNKTLEKHKLERDELIEEYESEKSEKEKIIKQYESEKSEKEEIIKKYESEKSEKEEIIKKYELEKLDLIKELKRNKENIIIDCEKKTNILNNKIKLCEEEMKKIKKINEKQEIEMNNQLESVIKIISYYKENSEQIVKYILDKNNNLIPDYFEKDIIRNTYNSLIDMIYKNIEKLK